jgi:NitT/TauT family transport system substrate-binding protein
MHPSAGRAIGAALVVTLAAGCGTTKTTAAASGPELHDITVGVVASEASAGVYVAEEQGLFRREGLNVTLRTITGAAAVLPGLLHGTMQVVSAQVTTFIQAQAAGVAQFRILAPGGSLGPGADGIVVLPSSPKTTAGQLKGTTIAVNALGGIDQILAEIGLRDYGITPAQVRYVAIPFQGMQAALAARRVGAAFLAEPYLTMAGQDLGAEMVLDADTGETTDLPISAYVTTRSWAQRYPRTAAAFSRAIDDADLLITTTPTVFIHAMESQLHLPKDVASVMGSGSFPTSLAAAHEQAVADILTSAGLLKHPFNVRVMLP